MLERDKAVLLVVDLQEKLLAHIHDQAGLLRRTERLIRGAHLLDVPIMVTEQYPRGLGHTDAGVRDALGDAYRPIEKAAISALGEPAFRESFAAVGRRQIILCGIEAHVCVYQTARDFRSDACAVHVVADCVGSREARDAEIGLQRMQQIGCCVTSHEMAIFEMLAVSGTSEFKQWVQMIR
jgi:nicotinamidase-related amidase